MLRSVSIAFYSTFSSHGYKSVQIQKLVKSFNRNKIKFKCYSISESFLNEKNENCPVVKTKWPILVNWIYIKFYLRKIYPNFYNYLIGEYFYYVSFGKKILKDDSEVVLLKSRPFQLVKLLKDKSSKFIIIEVDQLHPYFTSRILQNEYELFGIRNRTIYTNNYAVSNYVSAYNYADLLIVYSNFQRDQLISFGVKTKIEVVELGTENIFPDLLTFSQVEGDVVYIAFAHHTFVKGTHRLLEAWSQLPEKFKLFVLGSLGEDMTEYLNKSKLQSNIIFIKNFTSSQLFDFCKNKRVVGISLSLSDSYNRVVSEYLELGLPVIVSEILDRGIVKYDLGMVINAFDSESILYSIKEFSNLDTYDKFRSNVNKYSIIAETSKENYGDKYVEIIQNLDIQ